MHSCAVNSVVATKGMPAVGVSTDGGIQQSSLGPGLLRCSVLLLLVTTARAGGWMRW